MPPIPLHIEDPIAPTTTTTDESSNSTSSSNVPQSVAATTTSTPYLPQSDKTARPGALPSLPTATPALPKPQPQPTRTYIPTDGDLPPPPQPGAAPSVAAAYQANSTIPASTSYTPAMPVQSGWSAPQPNYAPTSTTDVTTPQRPRAGPTTLNMGPVLAAPSSHPPGYQQNAFAQDLSPQQRASLDQQRMMEKETPFASLTTPQTNETAENVWNAVKTWGSKASETAAKAHGEVWKWIDSKS